MRRRPTIFSRLVSGLLADFRTRIAAGAVGIAVIVGTVLTATALVHERQGAKESLLFAGRQLVWSFSRSTVLGVLAADREQVARLERAPFEVAADVTIVAVYREGRLFAGIERTPDGLREASSRSAPLAPAPGQIEIRSLLVAQRPAIAFVAPVVLEPAPGLLTDEGEPAKPETVATAEVVLSLERYHAAQSAMLLRNALLLALAMAVALSASALLARQMVRPIERLSAAAEKIGAGQLDVAVPVESTDQIGRLSKNFNQMVQDLRALEEGKTKFLAVVSHELRTPLVPLKNYLQLIVKGKLGDIPEPLRKPIESMNRSAARLTDHVERLLLFSVLSAGQLPTGRGPCDLKQCVRDAVEHLQPRLGELDQSLDLDLGDQPLPVLGDAVRLGQIFENLLSNASKFSGRGQTIRVHARLEGERAAVEVSDQGIGIPEDLQEKIFDRFYQVHRVLTRPYPGVGLGLAIVKELVARHGGTIQVRSRPGEGSTFRVELPLHRGGAA
jgi:signal transduction histidine kinase